MPKRETSPATRLASRREFLTTSAVVTGAAVTGSLAIARSAHAAGDDTLKIGLGETNWEYEGPKCNMYDAEHAALFASIREGKPINDGVWMSRSTMLGILSQMATYTGQEITWEQAFKSDHTLGPENWTWEMDPPVKPHANGRYPVPIPGVTKIG